MTAWGQPLGDGSITEEKVRALQALAGEHNDLDYKEFLDLSKTKDKVEMVKDFAALQSLPTGGYLLVGVDGNGVASNSVGQLNAPDFDAANLHRIAEPYLPTVQVRSATHVVDGITVAIVYVGPPEPPGVAILVRPGEYQDPASQKPKRVFSPGDVFVRRGTQSVRWSPGDLPVVLKRWEESIREDERRRAGAYADTLLRGERAKSIAEGPIGAMTWRLAAEDFDAVFLEAVRAEDTIALRRFVLDVKSDTVVALDSNDTGELTLVLDRLASALALTVTYDEHKVFALMLRGLADVYRGLLDAQGNVRMADDGRYAAFAWQVAVAVEAVGGLAVRLGQLWAVRPLAMPDPRLVALMGEPSWLRHALAAASRAGLLYAAPDEQGRRQEIGGPLVSVARLMVERLSALRPDTQVSDFELNSAPAELDPVLDSLIRFDVFWCVIAVANSMKERHQFPSFASFFSHRADPAFELLITDPAAREQLLDGDVENLKPAIRSVLDVAHHVAASQRRWPWSSESVVLNEYLRPE